MEEKFTIENHYSSCSASTVYIANDKERMKPVRLRFIQTEQGSKQSFGGLEFVKVLRRQCESMPTPSLLEVTDFGENQEGLWLVSPHQESATLLNFHPQAIGLEEFEAIARQLLEALAMAHQNNVYHGAITPSSIDVVSSPTGPLYRFTDFGLAKLYTILQPLSAEKRLHANALLTPPELFNTQEEPDGASDVFMIGQLFYLLLAGGHPWSQMSHNEVLEKHLENQLVPLHQLTRGAVPKALSEWVGSMVHSSPTVRPRDAEAALKSMPAAGSSAILEAARTELASESRAEKASRIPVKTKKKRKKITPATIYGSVAILALIASCAIILTVKHWAREESELTAETSSSGTSEKTSSNPTTENKEALVTQSPVQQTVSDPNSPTLSRTPAHKPTIEEDQQQTSANSQTDKRSVEVLNNDKNTVTENSEATVKAPQIAKPIIGNSIPNSIPQQSSNDPIKIPETSLPQPQQGSHSISTLIDFSPPNDFTTFKPIPDSFQPLSEQGIEISYSGVGTYFSDGNWNIFQRGSRSTEPMTMTFSGPVQIDSLDLATYHPRAAKIAIALYSDPRGDDKLETIILDIPARTKGTPGKNLTFVNVKELAKHGPKVRHMKIHSKALKGKAYAQVDNLQISSPKAQVLELTKQPSGQPVGTWTPEDIVPNGSTELIFPVSIDSNGPWIANLLWVLGEQGLKVESASIVTGTTIVAKASTQQPNLRLKKNSLFRFNISKANPNLVYNLKLNVASDGSSDSYGKVSFEKAVYVTPKVSVTSNMPPHKNYKLARSADYKPSTFFWCARQPQPKDQLTYTFHKVQMLKEITVPTGFPNSNKDKLRDGSVEYSLDGTSWQLGATFKEGTATIEFPQPTAVKLIRVNVAKHQNSWIAIRDLKIR